jgi:hypothetical protein
MVLVLNCILTQNNVREGYLIQNHEIIESASYIISKTYPTMNQKNTSYDVLVSKSKLNNEYDYYLKKLLKYSISKEDESNSYYTYNIKVVLINNEKVTLYSIETNDLSIEDEIYVLWSNIKDILYYSKYSKYIKNIYLDRL